MTSGADAEQLGGCGQPRAGWGALLWPAALFLLACKPVESFDTFWQLQSGRYIWQFGQFIHRDTFSLAADAFRLEHCWLSDLVFFAAYALGGYPALSLLKATVIAICGALLWRWNVVRGVRPERLLPLLLLCFLASEDSWLVRPQLWTFLFALIYLHLLHRGRGEGGRAWFWLAPVMLLWANLHAACVFGLVLIGLFGVGEGIRVLQGQAESRGLRRLALAGLLTLAATFVNPYGYRIPLILLDHISLHKLDSTLFTGNMEWLPPSFEQVPLFYIVMTLWGLLILCRLRRVDAAEAIFFIAFLYMGLSQIRHTTLVAMLSGYFIPLASQPFGWRLGEKGLLRHSGSALSRWGGALLLVGVMLFRLGSGSLGLGLKDGQYPVAAVDFILEQRLPANLYNSYDWGGFLMWKLFPEYRVFVDGRQGSQEHFDASSEVDNLWPGWESALSRYGVNTIITRTCYYDTGGPIPLVDGLVRNPRWVLVYKDETALVFVRHDDRWDFRLERFVQPSLLAYETMLGEARRLYAEDSSRSRALLAMGRAAMQLGRKQEALDSYRRYRQRVPGSREASLMVDMLGGVER